MKQNLLNPIVLIVLLAALGFAGPTAAAADKIKVVTTIPDLADMVREIGRDLVEVKSIAKGSEDMHSIPMKPSYLLLLNKADMLFEVGFDMEHAWLPDLLYNCRNEKIQPGAPGFVNCSARITPMEVPDEANRADGDTHPEGNPHYNLDPRRGRLMAVTICDGLRRAYPASAKAFEANLTDYLARFDRKLAEWEILARPLKGVKVITYHRSWTYFAARFGLDVRAEIEPKPGIAPTARHVARLIGQIREEKIELVIKELYYSNKYPEFLREKTGIKVINLPNMSGGRPETEGYFNFVEHNIRAILRTLGKPIPTREEIEKELQK